MADAPLTDLVIFFLQALCFATNMRCGYNGVGFRYGYNGVGFRYGYNGVGFRYGYNGVGFLRP